MIMYDGTVGIERYESCEYWHERDDDNGHVHEWCSAAQKVTRCGNTRYYCQFAHAYNMKKALDFPTVETRG